MIGCGEIEWLKINQIALKILKMDNAVTANLRSKTKNTLLC
jgi:hypothetical protein